MGCKWSNSISKWVLFVFEWGLFKILICCGNLCDNFFIDLLDKDDWFLEGDKKDINKKWRKKKIRMVFFWS